MIFQVSNIFTPAELQQLTPIWTEGEFVDGRQTAGWIAQQVKQNEQLKSIDPSLDTWKTIVHQAILRQELVQAAVRPRVIHSILLSRYRVGMAYGRHTDNALMGQWRSDVSFTIFLTDPQDYQGGELVIEGGQAEQSYKLPLNTAIVYPSSSLHRVNPITQGTRFAVVGWIQSWVRDPAQREILFDLEVVRRSLFRQEGKTAEFDLISKSLSNLLRQWMD